MIKHLVKFFFALFLTTFFLSIKNCKANYAMAIELFEDNDFDKAKRYLGSYAKRGSTIGLAYLKYMYEHKNPKIEYILPYASVPPKWLAESENALKASLAYMTIRGKNTIPGCKTKQQIKVSEKDAAFKQLISLVLVNKCARAAVLLGKLFENNLTQIQKFDAFKLFKNKKIQHASTFYPWVYRTLPPFKALSDINLLSKIHLYTSITKATQLFLEKNYPAYAKIPPNERLTFGVVSSKLHNFLKNKDKNLNNFLNNIFSMPICSVSVISLQNGDQSAASRIYYGTGYNQLTYEDTDAVNQYLYDVCEELPAKEFYKPIWAYKMFVSTKGRDHNNKKICSLLKYAFSKGEAHHIAYHIYAESLVQLSLSPKNIEEAKDYYRKAIKLGGHALPRFALIRLLGEKGIHQKDREEVLELLEPLCKENIPLALYTKGSILLDDQDPSKKNEASKALLDAHNAGFKSPDAILKYAQVKCLSRDQEQVEIAYNIFKTHKDIFDKDTKLKFMSCCLRLPKCPEFLESISYVKANIDSAPPFLVLKLIQVSMENIKNKKDAKGFITIIEKTKTIDPTVKEAYFALCFMLRLQYKIGSTEEARQMLEPLVKKAQKSLNMRLVFCLVARFAFEDFNFDCFSENMDIIQQAIQEGDSNALLLMQYSNIKNLLKQELMRSTENNQNNSIASSEESRETIDFPDIENDESDSSDSDDENSNAAEENNGLYDNQTHLDIQAEKERWRQDRQNKHRVRHKKTRG